MFLNLWSTSLIDDSVATSTLNTVSDLQNPNAPEDGDIEGLATELQRNGVAFGTDNPANAQLGQALTGTLQEVGADADGPMGVVVLEHTPEHLADLRDIAQDIANASGYATVIVRTPHATLGVSDTLTRAQIERGQVAMVAQPDYPEGLRAFVSAAEDFAVNWVLVSAVAVAILAVAVIASFRPGGRSSLEA